MSKAFKCDLCGRREDGKPWIAFFNYPEYNEPLVSILKKFKSHEVTSGYPYEGHIAHLELCSGCKSTYYGNIVDLFPEEDEEENR